MFANSNIDDLILRSKLENSPSAIELETKTNRPLTWSKGTIYKWFPTRGYGFIRPDDNGLDVWIHASNCVEGYIPQEGDNVVYLTRLGPRGGLIAKEADITTNDKPWPKGCCWKDSNGIIHATEEHFVGFLNEDEVIRPIRPNSQPDLAEDIKHSMYDLMYGKRS